MSTVSYIVFALEIAASVVCLIALATRGRLAWFACFLVLIVPILARQSVGDSDSQEPHDVCSSDPFCMAENASWILLASAFVTGEAWHIAVRQIRMALAAVAVLLAVVYTVLANMASSLGNEARYARSVVLAVMATCGFASVYAIWRRMSEDERSQTWSIPWNKARRKVPGVVATFAAWFAALALELWSNWGSEFEHRVATFVLLLALAISSWRIHKPRTQERYSALAADHIQLEIRTDKQEEKKTKQSKIPKEKPTKHSKTLGEKLTKPEKRTKVPGTVVAVPKSSTDELTSTSLYGRLYPTLVNDDAFKTLNDLGLVRSAMTVAECIIYIYEVLQPRQDGLVKRRETQPAYAQLAKPMLDFASIDSQLFRRADSKSPDDKKSAGADDPSQVQSTDDKAPPSAAETEALDVLQKAFADVDAKDLLEMDRCARAYVRLRFNTARILSDLCLGPILDLARMECEFATRELSNVSDKPRPKLFEFLHRCVLPIAVRYGASHVSEHLQTELSAWEPLMRRLHKGQLRQWKQQWNRCVCVCVCDGNNSPDTRLRECALSLESDSERDVSAGDIKARTSSLTSVLDASDNVSAAEQAAMLGQMDMGTAPGAARTLWKELRTKIAFYHLLFLCGRVSIPVHLLVRWCLDFSSPHHVITAWRRLPDLVKQDAITTEATTPLGSRNLMRAHSTRARRSSLLMVASKPMASADLSSDSETGMWRLSSPNRGKPKSSFTFKSPALKPVVAHAFRESQKEICQLLVLCAMAFRHSSRPARMNAYLNARLREKPILYQSLQQMVERIQAPCRETSPYAPFLEYQLRSRPSDLFGPEDLQGVPTWAGAAARHGNQQCLARLDTVLRQGFAAWVSGRPGSVMRIAREGVKQLEHHLKGPFRERVFRLARNLMGLFPMPALAPGPDSHLVLTEWLDAAPAQEWQDTVAISLVLLVGFFVESDSGRSMLAVARAELPPVLLQQIEWHCALKRSDGSARAADREARRATVLEAPSFESDPSEGETKTVSFADLGGKDRERKQQYWDAKDAHRALVQARLLEITVPVHVYNPWSPHEHQATELALCGDALVELGQEAIANQHDLHCSMALTYDTSESDVVAKKMLTTPKTKLVAVVETSGSECA